MVIDLDIDEKQVDRYRQIALDYLSETDITICVRPKDHRFEIYLLNLNDESKSYCDNNIYESLEEAIQHIEEDFLPNLGLQVQQEKIKTFQMLI